MSSLSRPRSYGEHSDTKILGKITYLSSEVLILTFLRFFCITVTYFRSLNPG